jgi:hypothetical protein
LNDSYGSSATVKGVGILLNNEMDDFAAKPGTPNMYGLIQGERNAVAPRKRPLSAMTPTIVLRKDGSLWFTIGSPGGPTIINTVLCVITNVIDYDMNIQQAIDAPRIHHQWLPDEMVGEPYGLSGDTQRALSARGHALAKQRDHDRRKDGRPPGRDRSPTQRRPGRRLLAPVIACQRRLHPSVPSTPRSLLKSRSCWRAFIAGCAWKRVRRMWPRGTRMMGRAGGFI